MTSESIDLFLLTKELAKLPKETSWLEFKLNKDDYKMMGENISALANAAVLAERDYAYLIWGEESAASISRLIKDAVDAKSIKPYDPATARRYMKYLPIWA